jgi:hypothetical protein
MTAKIRGRCVFALTATATVIVMSVAVVAGRGSAEAATARTKPFLLPTFPPGCPHTGVGALGPVVPIRVLRAPASSALIVAGVCVNGEGPFPFVVDTGAGITTIDSSLASRLHLVDPSPPEQTNSFGCSRRIFFAPVANMSVGRVGLRGQNVVVGTLRSPDAPGLMGVLGSDVLSRFGVVRIDFDRSTMSFLGPEEAGIPASKKGDGATPSVPPALSTGTAYKVNIEVNTASVPIPDRPAVSEVVVTTPVRLGQHQQVFVLDTGAARTNVAPSVAASAHLVASLGIDRIYAGLACPVLGKNFVVASWQVGGVALAPQTVGSSVVPSGVQGLLGSGTLQRYSPVVVDYKDGELLLGRPNGPSPVLRCSSSNCRRHSIRHRRS